MTISTSSAFPSSFNSVSALALLAALGSVGCVNADEVGTRCDTAELKCPIGSRPNISKAAQDGCAAEGEGSALEESAALSGRCNASGECTFLCEVTPCCGGEHWGNDSYSCEVPCGGSQNDEDESTDSESSETDESDAESSGPNSSSTEESDPDATETRSSDATDSDSTGAESTADEATANESSDAASEQPSEESAVSTETDAVDETTVESADAGGPASEVDSKCIARVGGNYAVRKDGYLVYETRDRAQEKFVGDEDGLPIGGIVDATAGGYHACALRDDQTVVCWRLSSDRGNNVGQLGNGAVDNDTTAAVFRASTVMIDDETQLTGVAKLVRIGDNANATCAITDEKNLYCWGDLTWVVNGGKSIASPYAQIVTKDGLTPLEGVLDVGLSPWMNCVILEGAENNELYCWGLNDYGNLANGNTTAAQYPVQVTSVKSPTQVAVVRGGYAAGHGGTACVVDDDEVKCWGYADGTTTPTARTIDAEGATKLPAPAQLIGDAEAFCAVANDKKLWCWGYGFNSYATPYGATNVTSIGLIWRLATGKNYPIFATSDGKVHWGPEWAESPNCAAP